MQKREGYGHLLSYIIRIGDLLVINGLYIGLLYLMKRDGAIGTFSAQDLIIYITFLNLTYFFVSNIVRPNTIEHFVFFDKVIQKASVQILLYMLCLTAVLSISKIFEIPALEWTLGNLFIGGVFVSWHSGFRILLKKYRKKGLNYRFVVIVGSDAASVDLYEEMAVTAYGYKLIGYFSDKLYEGNKKYLPYLGVPSSIEEYIKDHRVDELYYASTEKRDVYVKPLIKVCEKNMIRFFLIPEYYKYVKRRMVMNMLNNTPLLSLRNEPLQDPVNRISKRIVDIVLSSLILVTIFPWMYIILGTIIKITSPGPVFFKQKRTGIQGEEFNCYKFRSMRPNKASDLHQATRNDPRVTKIGAFMRKTSLDEFPQFINVLKGDMSIVGPRPHMLKHTEEYSELIGKFMVRHLVKPGITGWAQVTGWRGETKTVYEMEERVKKDVWYIENWSLSLDLKIIFLTVINVFKGEENAF